MGERGLKSLIVILFCAFGAVAAPPRFSLPGGVYTNDIALELTASPPSAVIRLTLDGSEPTATSSAYMTALIITNSVLVRARTFERDAPSGPIASETYILLGSDLLDFTSNLPLVIINTFGQSVSHQTKVPVSVRFIGCGAGGRSSLTGRADFEGRATLNIRGTSSLQFPKHSFSLKTKDDAGKSLKASILGFPADADWILYAPYPDKTLMRDVLAYDLSNQMGHYAPRTRFVEVFATRSDQKLGRGSYLGVYVFEERIKRGPQRVNIAKLQPSSAHEPEVSGGYIFKKDHDKSPGGFTTSHGIHFYYVDPKENKLNSPQKAWLTGYLNQFEKSLYGAEFKDPVQGYAAYIDSSSFIDLHWTVEISKNIDGYRLSNYLHKDRNGKLKMEPIWDWNLSFGNADFHEGWLPEGWYWPLISHGDYPWFRRLFEDPDFKQKYIDRWAQLRTNQFAVSNILAKIDAMALQLEEAQRRNFKRWRILNRAVWPNWYVGSSYAEEVDWMKHWIEQRIAWIDQQFVPAPAVSIQNASNGSNRLLNFQPVSGDIYYTLDGTDPRSPGGAISPQAKRFRNEISVEQGVKFFARTYSASGWSAPVRSAGILPVR